MDSQKMVLYCCAYRMTNEDFTEFHIPSKKHRVYETHFQKIVEAERCVTHICVSLGSLKALQDIFTFPLIISVLTE